MIDPQGDRRSSARRRACARRSTKWIPNILAAQEPDGYLQTAFTLPRARNAAAADAGPFHTGTHRGDHEGYIAGYFLESAINHYLMTGRKDARLYNAAKKLADCWCDNIGPAPKKAWYDGHQEMEQALVRFGRFVNDMEGGGRATSTSSSRKFLLDVAATARELEYDQSHLPPCAAVRSRGPRRARHVQLLGHGRRRGGERTIPTTRAP